MNDNIPPALPIAVAESVLATLDRQGGHSEFIQMRREDIYSMVRDASRATAQLAWAEGVAAREVSGEYEEIENPYLGSYWPELDK